MSRPSGPSAGVLGEPIEFSTTLARDFPDISRALATAGRRPRAGHDRNRWTFVNWEDYRAQVGVEQSLGPWRIGIAEDREDGPQRWLCEAMGMPYVPGWYTALIHKTRGLVMADTPAEAAGFLPFADRLAAGPPPTAVLVAGLGLGIVPRWIGKRWPGCRVDVVEIEKDIVRLVMQDVAARADWARRPGLHIHIGDAHLWTAPTRRGCWLHKTCLPPGDRQPANPGRWIGPARWDAAWFDIWDMPHASNLPSMRLLTRRFRRPRAGWSACWERPECEAQARRPRPPGRVCHGDSETGYA